MTPQAPTPADTMSAAETEQWQSIFDTLEDAARACDAACERVGTYDGELLWSLDALAVLLAADALRSALALHLPYSTPPVPGDGEVLATGPVTLLEHAWSQLQGMPDYPDNPALLLAQVNVADALTAVRGHCE